MWHSKGFILVDFTDFDLIASQNVNVSGRRKNSEADKATQLFQGYFEVASLTLSHLFGK